MKRNNKRVNKFVFREENHRRDVKKAMWDVADKYDLNCLPIWGGHFIRYK